MTKIVFFFYFENFNIHFYFLKFETLSPKLHYLTLNPKCRLVNSRVKMYFYSLMVISVTKTFKRWIFLTKPAMNNIMLLNKIINKWEFGRVVWNRCKWYGLKKKKTNILILSYKIESILSSLKMTLHTASKAKVYEVFIVHLMKQMKKSYNLKVAEKQIEKAKWSV